MRNRSVAALLLLGVVPILFAGCSSKPDIRQVDPKVPVLEKVETLSGLLPICASCKNVRDDQGYWRRIEGYISERSGAEFSHGLCPTCATELHAKLDALDDRRGKPHEDEA